MEKLLTPLEINYNETYKIAIEYFIDINEIIINDSFRKRIPPLQPEEYALLEKSIISEECKNAIILWNKTIVDGHNRYDICKKYGIAIKATDKEFTDIEECLDFIDTNQLSRRNLTDDQRKILIGRRYNREKSKQGGDKKSKGKVFTLINTAEKLADENRISERTVKNYGKLATEYEEMEVEKPTLAKDLFDGKITFKGIKADEKSKKIEEKKAEYVEKYKGKLMTIPEVFLMDCKDFLNTFPDDSIDFLYTDPPYSTDISDIKAFTKSWLPLAIKKTKKSGRMLVFSGAYPIEIQAFLNVLLNQSKFIVDNPLVWIFNNTLGVTPKMNYNLNYQLIWHLYSNKSAPLDISITNDMFSAQVENAPDGRQGNKLHKWQKSDDLAIKHITQTTQKGDLVVDPFTCTGTFLIAAGRLGRKCKGCDNDQTNLNIAISRGCQLMGK
jgi:DNA modification methylase